MVITTGFDGDSIGFTARTYPLKTFPEPTPVHLGLASSLWKSRRPSNDCKNWDVFFEPTEMPLYTIHYPAAETQAENSPVDSVDLCSDFWGIHLAIWISSGEM